VGNASVSPWTRSESRPTFASANSLDYPLLSDVGGNVARLYGVKRVFDFLKVKRTTFVIDRDLTILDVINSEMSMEVHADRALTVLKARA
jgi:peroxiredoxin Q/BCP